MIGLEIASTKHQATRISVHVFIPPMSNLIVNLIHIVDMINDNDVATFTRNEFHHHSLALCPPRPTHLMTFITGILVRR
jgi:hypothetical protein